MDGEGNGNAAALLPQVSRAVDQPPLSHSAPLRQADVGFDLHAGSAQKFTNIRGPPELN